MSSGAGKRKFWNYERKPTSLALTLVAANRFRTFEGTASHILATNKEVASHWPNISMCSLMLNDETNQDVGTSHQGQDPRTVVGALAVENRASDLHTC